MRQIVQDFRFALTFKILSLAVSVIPKTPDGLHLVRIISVCLKELA